MPFFPSIDEVRALDTYAIEALAALYREHGDWVAPLRSLDAEQARRSTRPLKEPKPEALAAYFSGFEHDTLVRLLIHWRGPLPADGRAAVVVGPREESCMSRDLLHPCTDDRERGTLERRSAASRARPSRAPSGKRQASRPRHRRAAARREIARVHQQMERGRLRETERSARSQTRAVEREARQQRRAQEREVAATARAQARAAEQRRRGLRALPGAVGPRLLPGDAVVGRARGYQSSLGIQSRDQLVAGFVDRQSA